MPPVMPDGDDRKVVIAPTSKMKIRHQIVGRGLRYHHFRKDIAYSQARPSQIRLPRETTRMDCSGLVAACMDFAGVMPKVDWRYTNTWLQIRFGRAVELRFAKPGDVVFYGRPGDPTHEALFLGTRTQLDEIGVEPPHQMKGGRWVLTNGHYPMSIEPVDYRSDRIAVRTFL